MVKTFKDLKKGDIIYRVNKLFYNGQEVECAEKIKVINIIKYKEDWILADFNFGASEMLPFDRSSVQTSEGVYCINESEASEIVKERYQNHIDWLQSKANLYLEAIEENKELMDSGLKIIDRTNKN